MKINENVSIVVDSLFDAFKHLEGVEYSYGELSDTHFVKITKEMFDSDEFGEWEDRVSSKWMETQEEFLCFVTEESVTKLKNPEYLHNYYNLQAILSNISVGKGYPKNTYSVNIIEDLMDLNHYNEFPSDQIAGESDYALAA